MESQDNQELFDELEILLKDLKGKWRLSIENMELAQSEVLPKFIEIRNRFLKKKEIVKEEIAQVKRQINIPEVSPDEYGKLVRQREQVKIVLAEIGKYAKKVDELVAQKKTLYSELQNLWHKQWMLREAKTAEVNKSQEIIKLEVKYKGHKEEFSKLLQTMFQGTRIRGDKLKKVAEAFSDGIEIFNVLNQKARFIHVGFSDIEWQKFRERVIEQQEFLCLTRIPDCLEISYLGRPIQQLSLGQRASALLLLLLSLENIPIIVDQPEDDLDSQTVYEGLVKEILKLKGQRQIIFATHNPNIPVLGDCEQVVVFSVEGDRTVTINGSIDVESIQRSIVDIMEGGAEAFAKRKEIYSLWTP